MCRSALTRRLRTLLFALIGESSAQTSNSGEPTSTASVPNQPAAAAPTTTHNTRRNPTGASKFARLLGLTAMATEQPAVSTSAQVAPAPAASAPASAAPAAPAPSSGQEELLRSDASGFIQRYRTALNLERWKKHGKTLQKKDRGTVMGTVRLLCEPEEQLAQKQIADEARKARTKLQEQAAMAAAESKFAFQPAAFPPAAAAAAVPSGAAAVVAAKKLAASSLEPLPLPTECNVCYATFNTVAPPADDPDAAPIALRCHMRLCGHASICSDCFTSYLASRITSGECMPFIPCPHPDCKLPIHSADLVASVPTPEAVQTFEAEYARNDEIRVKRNNAAWDAMHARVLQMNGTSSDASKNKRKGKTKKAKAKKASNGSGSNSSGNSSDASADEEEEEEEEEDIPAAPTSSASSAPWRPSFLRGDKDKKAVELPPLVSTDLLLQLVIHQMGKLLNRSRHWLPCGTFVKRDDEPEEQEEKSEASSTDQPASLASVLTSSLSTRDQSPPRSRVAHTPPSTPAPASSAAADTGSLASCPYGFYLVPPLWTPGCGKRLKKCDHCGLLQELKPKNSGEEDAISRDPEVVRMLAEGTLRPCPICDCLQMRDKGMCNVMQCPSCAIYWNWADRSTGKNEAELKNRARSYGTLWEQGELHYQMHLQRTDLPAFKALLARNGIEYRENYVRGSG